MPGKLYIPKQVLDSIQKHVVSAVKHAESGYCCAQEEEDTITGDLLGALRTSGTKGVDVTDSVENRPGRWRWSISYSKFRSKAKNATEKILGADGILEIKVGSAEAVQQKSALFQSKNAAQQGSKLIEQCVKMSVWREASFIINYTANGYNVYSIDEVLLSNGNIEKSSGGKHLAQWLMDTFIACKVGHPDLYYEKEDRRLYWVRKESSENEYKSDRWVWVNFKPKYRLSINVTPPHWEQSRAIKISRQKILYNRLSYTAEDIFGLQEPFTLSQLKKRRSELLKAYHSDRNHNLSDTLKSILDKRIIEINSSFSELLERAIDEKKQQKKNKTNEKETRSGVEQRKEDEYDELLKKGAAKDNREKVKVRRKR